MVIHVGHTMHMTIDAAELHVIVLYRIESNFKWVE